MSYHQDRDLHDALLRARPTDTDLREGWPAQERDDLLRRIRGGAGRDEASTAPRSTRGRVALLAAAATVAAALVVPVVVSGGDAEARAELLRLAGVAAEGDGPVVGPGELLHVEGWSLQENSSLFGDGLTLDDEYENWVRWDGATWVVLHRPSAGWTERAFYPPPRRADFGTPTPRFVADLPDDAAGLRAYLDDTVSGSNSHDEALFVAVSDLVNSRLLDPATFAVALEVLADVGGVETRDVEVDGRDAVAISHDRFVVGALGRKTIVVDRETGQLLGSESSDPGGRSRARITLLETVDRVPERVRADLRRYGNGSRTCADGQEADPHDGTCA
ncbi:hypothetical protein GCM10009737_26100 [Nocardioides lentus]|uniref:CU044_5270 family protein n=1 Tax=Nocardioides lentus TaxID=338077 RepID=A0ABN2PK55_9ACTN